jgi:hypothetical protein
LLRELINDSVHGYQRAYFEITNVSIPVKEKTTAKIAETDEYVCLKMCLPFTHTSVSETSPYSVKIFTIK